MGKPLWVGILRISALLTAAFSLGAFGLVSTFLSSLYPLFPEMLCYSGYAIMFEVLLATPFILYLMSLGSVSRPASQISRMHAGVAAGAAAVSLFIFVRVVGLIVELRSMQIDAGCLRSEGPALLQVFTMSYVGPVITLVLLVIAVVVIFRGMREHAF